MTTLNITGMTCPHCVKAVEDALAEVAGVSRVVAVNLDAGTAEVEGNAQASALVAAVEEEGYTASVA